MFENKYRHNARCILTRPLCSSSLWPVQILKKVSFPCAQLISFRLPVKFLVDRILIVVSKFLHRPGVFLWTFTKRFVCSFPKTLVRLLFAAPEIVWDRKNDSKCRTNWQANDQIEVPPKKRRRSAQTNTIGIRPATGRLPFQYGISIWF